jgi:S1-C subfamily serine protease
MVFRPSEDYGESSGSDLTGLDVGSGVIVDSRGYILTNHHVVASAQEIRVQLSDGRIVNAELIGQDRVIDLAVLRINANNLRAIDWGDSRNVAVGERVLAIGSPYGLQQTFTAGIVSATERYNAARVIRGPRRSATVFPHAFLQTDAAINPGNSGGALVDMNGKLIGICTSIISADDGGNSGIGFAIPSFTAKHIYEEIMLFNETRRGWIGVRPDELIWYDAHQIGQERPKGAIIIGFWTGSPAFTAGLRRNDIILRWGETEIKCPLHLVHLVTLTEPGTIVPVEIFRRGEIFTFEITVGSRPMDL